MKRYKVWATGEDAVRQRTVLLQQGCLDSGDPDHWILLVRTGSDETCPFDAGAFDGAASEVAMLACKRTGYAGTVAIKDFGRQKGPGQDYADRSDEEWFHGRANAEGATVARGRQ